MTTTIAQERHSPTRKITFTGCPRVDAVKTYKIGMMQALIKKQIQVPSFASQAFSFIIGTSKRPYIFNRNNVSSLPTETPSHQWLCNSCGESAT